VISGVFSNALAVFTILVISFYMILERQHLSGWLTRWFGDSEAVIEDLLVRIETKIGAWIRGQIILSLIIGGAVYIGLISLSIPYAVPLAIIAGLMESIPNIGPTVSMVPAAVVGFTISPLHGGAVILLYFLIQQFENNLIVPLVMRRAVGLNPLVIIISLMIGLALGGPAGAVLSIPVVLVGEVLVPYFIGRSKSKV
jgi:predicted PurR-regulated permease PerM